MISLDAIAIFVISLFLLYVVILTIFRVSALENGNLLDTALYGSIILACFFGVYLKNADFMANPVLLSILAGYVAYLEYSRNVVGNIYAPIDQEGKIFIVTGSNTGIGYETVRELIDLNATVVMACRSIEKAKKAREQIILETNCAPSKIFVLKLDLCSLASVHNFVQEFRDLGLSLHCLINNAGLMMQEKTQTEDGFETMFAANHLCHFLLTILLLPDLRRTRGRVVVLTSILHGFAKKLDLGLLLDEALKQEGIENFNIKPSSSSYEMFRVYGQTKLANLLFTLEFNKRFRSIGIEAVSVHPGCVRTEVTRHMHWLMQLGNAIFAPLMRTLQKTPSQGAYTSVHCAIGDLAVTREINPPYYFHCQPAECYEAARNEEDARKLWEVSEFLTRVNSN